jgi:hypothetical protein
MVPPSAPNIGKQKIGSASAKTIASGSSAASAGGAASGAGTGVASPSGAPSGAEVASPRTTASEAGEASFVEASELPPLVQDTLTEMQKAVTESARGIDSTSASSHALAGTATQLPWGRSTEEVEFATLEWIDWFNTDGFSGQSVTSHRQNTKQSTIDVSRAGLKIIGLRRTVRPPALAGRRHDS